MELASRDIVSRAEPDPRSNEGPRVGPDGQGIYLDITSCRRKRTLEALREIVNIGSRLRGRRHHAQPIIIQPGQHYIWAASQTEHRRTDADRGLYAAGEVACRLGPRRQTVSRQLAASNTLIFGRRSVSTPPSGRVNADAGRCQASTCVRRQAHRGDHRRPRKGRRVSEIQRMSSAPVMNRHVAVFRRTRRALRTAADTVARLKERRERVHR